MLAQYFDILVLLIVVGVIFYRLRSILGTRPEGTEQSRMSDESAAKIFDMIMKEAESKNIIDDLDAEKQPVDIFEPGDEVGLVLSKIPNFSKESFISGAKKAFEIIIEAFAKGDVKTLEMLVSKNLLKKFQEVIDKRSAEGLSAETDFIGFEKAEIISAQVSKSNIAKIMVEFVSEQVNLIKNKEGETIEGDDEFIQNITDKWTFERSLTSTNPNWLLVSTKK